MKKRGSKKPVRTKAKYAKAAAKVETNEEISSPAVIKDAEKPVSAAQQEQLVSLEKVIANAQTQFEEVGRALHLINAGDLYKGSYETFVDYCDKKWGMADKHVYRLLKSYEAMEVLRAAGVDDHLLPKNEYKIREVIDWLLLRS